MAGGTPMRVGVVGCGDISDIYLQNGLAPAMSTRHN